MASATDELEVEERRKLFIGGLSYETTDESLCRAFEKYGKVVAGRVMMNKETNASRGFGFVTFENAADADKAVQEMNGQPLDGRPVRVDHATKKGEHPIGRPPPTSAPSRSNVCYQWQEGTCSRGSSCRFEHPSTSGSRGGSHREQPYAERGGYADDKRDSRYDQRRSDDRRGDYRSGSDYPAASSGDYGRDYRSSESGRGDYRSSDRAGGYGGSASDYYRAADYPRTDYRDSRDAYRSSGDYRSGSSSDYYRSAPAADYRASDYRASDNRADDYKTGSAGGSSSAYYRDDAYRSASAPDYRSDARYAAAPASASYARDYRAAAPSTGDYRSAAPSSSGDYRSAAPSSSGDYRSAAPSGSGSASAGYGDRDYRSGGKIDSQYVTMPAGASSSAGAYSAAPRDDRRDYYASGSTR